MDTTEVITSTYNKKQRKRHIEQFTTISCVRSNTIEFYMVEINSFFFFAGILVCMNHGPSAKSIYSSEELSDVLGNTLKI